MVKFGVDRLKDVHFVNNLPVDLSTVLHNIALRVTIPPPALIAWHVICAAGFKQAELQSVKSITFIYISQPIIWRHMPWSTFALRNALIFITYFQQLFVTVSNMNLEFTAPLCTGGGADVDDVLKFWLILTAPWVQQLFFLTTVSTKNSVEISASFGLNEGYYSFHNSISVRLSHRVINYERFLIYR
jgi:hypothetical protein